MLVDCYFIVVRLILGGWAIDQPRVSRAIPVFAAISTLCGLVILQFWVKSSHKSSLLLKIRHHSLDKLFGRPQPQKRNRNNSLSWKYHNKLDRAFTFACHKPCQAADAKVSAAA